MFNGGGWFNLDVAGGVWYTVGQEVSYEVESLQPS